MKVLHQHDALGVVQHDDLHPARAQQVLPAEERAVLADDHPLDQLLGNVDLEQRETRTALDLALLCWRLRLNGGRAASSPR